VEWVKPGIELLAGIPSVVIGAFAVVVMAPLFQASLEHTLFSALLAGAALGFAVIPIVFSIAEDARSRAFREVTRKPRWLGFSRWQTAWHIVLPAALPGVFAAVVLGFGRAFGETMIVLIASGNASIMSWSILIRPDDHGDNRGRGARRNRSRRASLSNALSDRRAVVPGHIRFEPHWRIGHRPFETQAGR
jgi:ABC-type phosphate transport system permease subunit